MSFKKKKKYFYKKFSGNCRFLRGHRENHNSGEAATMKFRIRIFETLNSESASLKTLIVNELTEKKLKNNSGNK